MPFDYLQIADKSFLVFGVANRKSVAYHIGQTLEQAGARVVYVVRDDALRQRLTRLLGSADQPRQQ